MSMVERKVANNWKDLLKYSILFLVLVCILFSGTKVYAAIDETEPNDTLEQADIVKMGETVYGDDSCAHEWEFDQDYFKVIPPVSGTVKVTATLDTASSIYRALCFIAYDGNQEITRGYDYTDTTKGATISFPVVSEEPFYLKASVDEYEYQNPNAGYHIKFSYSIGKTTIKKATGKKKSLNVVWNKKSKASFYQVQYTKKSTYEDYNWKKAKTVKVSSKKNSKTIKKLAKKKTYYVRVRVAREIDGVIYYSGWSKKKTVKTK